MVRLLKGSLLLPGLCSCLSLLKRALRSPHFSSHWSFVPSLRCLFLQWQHRGRGERGSPNPIAGIAANQWVKYRRIKVRLCLAPHKNKAAPTILYREISPSYSLQSYNIYWALSVHKLTCGCKIMNNCLQRTWARELKYCLNAIFFTLTPCNTCLPDAVVNPQLRISLLCTILHTAAIYISEK